MDSVPEGQARLKGERGGFGGFGPVLRRGAEVAHHLESFGPVLIAVEFDMALQVEAEGRDAAGELGVEVADEPGEHLGDEVFAAEGEGGCDAVWLIGGDDREGGADEGGGLVGDGSECLLERHCGGEGGEEGVDWLCVCSAALHGMEVELEVGERLAVVRVGLLAEDDLVDEAAGGWVGGREPRDVDAGEGALEALEERHEVPDCVDVRLHEEVKGFKGVDGAVERVVAEVGLERGEGG